PAGASARKTGAAAGGVKARSGTTPESATTPSRRSSRKAVASARASPAVSGGCRRDFTSAKPGAFAMTATAGNGRVTFGVLAQDEAVAALDALERPHRHAVVIGRRQTGNLVVGAPEARHRAREKPDPLADEATRVVERLAEQLHPVGRLTVGVLDVAAQPALVALLLRRDLPAQLEPALAVRHQGGDRRRWRRLARRAARRRDGQNQRQHQGSHRFSSRSSATIVPPRRARRRAMLNRSDPTRVLRGARRRCRRAWHPAPAERADAPALAHGLLRPAYPLHPPGRPERRRTEHLITLRTPTLFVHGTRDPFGFIDELDEARGMMPGPTRLLAVRDVGHDLGARRDAAFAEAAVAELLALLG